MNVYFTVDTESSMGGALRFPDRRPVSSDRHIFCRIGGEDHGIGLITRILSEHGFRATHFVETLVSLCNGHDDTQAVFDFLLSRGQDVQLHIHPVYRYYSKLLRARAAAMPYELPQPNDVTGDLPESTQAEILSEAKALFRRFTGFDPTAFRAGCFAAGRSTLRCLSALGIRLDSSFNPCYPGLSFRNDNLVPNRTCLLEGVWELPITVAHTPLPEGYGGLKAADPCAISTAELRSMLEAGAESGQQHFVIVFHSFSAVKAADETYAEIRPDRIVIRRLKELAKYLDRNRSVYTVSTFGDLAGKLPLADSGAPLSRLNLLSAGVRKSVQALNRLHWM